MRALAREGERVREKQLTQQRYLLIADLVEGHANARGLAVNECEFATNRFPRESSDGFLTLNCIHRHLLLLHMEDLKVVEQALQ